MVLDASNPLSHVLPHVPNLHHPTLDLRCILRMADADSVLEAAEFASVFPEIAGILFLLWWCPVLVAVHTYAMERLLEHEYLLVPLVVCRFPRVAQTLVKTCLHRILAWWY